MKMKRVIFVVLVCIATVQAAFAATMSEKVLQNLKAQGYDVVQMDRTWLGRIWVLARSQTLQREIVFNPTTGEILRDYAVTLASLKPEDRGGDTQVATAPKVPGAPPEVVALSSPTAATADPEMAADAVPESVMVQPVDPTK